MALSWVQALVVMDDCGAGFLHKLCFVLPGAVRARKQTAPGVTTGCRHWWLARANHKCSKHPAWEVLNRNIFSSTLPLSAHDAWLGATAGIGRCTAGVAKPLTLNLGAGRDSLPTQVPMLLSWERDGAGQAGISAAQAACPEPSPPPCPPYPPSFPDSAWFPRAFCCLQDEEGGPVKESLLSIAQAKRAAGMNFQDKPGTQHGRAGG